MIIETWPGQGRQQCPVDMPAARAWECIACGRGRGAAELERADQDTAGESCPPAPASTEPRWASS